MLPLIRKRKLPPSSQLYTWDIIAFIIGLDSSWDSIDFPLPSFPIEPGREVNCDTTRLKDRATYYVDASHSEIGRYPLLECIVLDGLLGIQPIDYKLNVIPQLGLAPPSGSSADFSITVKTGITLKGENCEYLAPA